MKCRSKQTLITVFLIDSVGKTGSPRVSSSSDKCIEGREHPINYGKNNGNV